MICGSSSTPIPGLVWTARPDGRIDFLNQRWREYTGLTLEQAGGWGWRAAIHPEDLFGLVNYWKSMLASGKPREAEARLRRFDGTYRWFLFCSVPWRDGLGLVRKWYGTLTDIEDRKWAGAVSRQSAVMAERNRMARDIHDTLAQGFTGVILQLEAVEEAMSQRLAAKAGEHLTRAGELAREGLREARRSVWALRPQTLEEKDLCEASGI